VVVEEYNNSVIAGRGSQARARRAKSDIPHEMGVVMERTQLDSPVDIPDANKFICAA
jgi:hypothetical protein